MLIVTVPTSNSQSCDLDQLATNVNPDWLSNCHRNLNCTQLMCQAEGELENFFHRIIFTDMTCLTLPAVRIAFAQNNSGVSSDNLVTTSQVVTSTNHAIGGVLSIVIFAESTIGHSINITVRNGYTASCNVGYIYIPQLLCRLIR